MKAELFPYLRTVLRCLGKGTESMTFWELLITAFSLSADAFAAAVCKGLAAGKLNGKQALIVGLWFGSFQALMPALGYLLGLRFTGYIAAIDHWIAFILLGTIGTNMIRESFAREDDLPDGSFRPKAMLPLAVATSIDALAVGVTFAFLGVRLLPSVTLIGFLTFLISAAGAWLGHLSGVRFRKPAERTGGLLLILMGVKILLGHLGVV